MELDGKTLGSGETFSMMSSLNKDVLCSYDSDLPIDAENMTPIRKQAYEADSALIQDRLERAEQTECDDECGCYINEYDTDTYLTPRGAKRLREEIDWEDVEQMLNMEKVARLETPAPEKNLPLENDVETNEEDNEIQVEEEYAEIETDRNADPAEPEVITI